MFLALSFLTKNVMWPAASHLSFLDFSTRMDYTGALSQNKLFSFQLEYFIITGYSVCKCGGADVCASVYVCVSQQSSTDITSQDPSTISTHMLRQGLSLEPEACWLDYTGKPESVTALPVLSSPALGYKEAGPHTYTLYFCMDTVDHMQVPMLSRQAIYWLNCSPAYVYLLIQIFATGANIPLSF